MEKPADGIDFFFIWCILNQVDFVRFDFFLRPSTALSTILIQYPSFESICPGIKSSSDCVLPDEPLVVSDFHHTIKEVIRFWRKFVAMSADAGGSVRDKVATKGGFRMDYKTVILERKDGVAVLTLNRPDVLNSVNMEMRSEILNILDSLERDSSVRVLVVTGAGRAFCAGADINEFKESGKDPEMQKFLNKKLIAMARAFYEFEKPIIGAINGVSAGDGSQWVLAFDLNVASEKARFGWPATYLGIL